jgi:hypothetical protein
MADQSESSTNSAVQPVFARTLCSNATEEFADLIIIAGPNDKMPVIGHGRKSKDWQWNDSPCQTGDTAS